MKLEIGCREIGGECDFVASGDSEEEILSRFMKHVQLQHDDDWFSIEEIHAAACALIRRKVA